MPRFVILRHEFPPGDPRPSHWDLMLEVEGHLRTWALNEIPQPGLVAQARALGDHRLHYLSYEGPVSDGRGTVRRHDEGTYHLEEERDDQLVAVLSGNRLSGRLALVRDPADQAAWKISC